MVPVLAKAQRLIQVFEDFVAGFLCFIGGLRIVVECQPAKAATVFVVQKNRRTLRSFGGESGRILFRVAMKPVVQASCIL